MVCMTQKKADFSVAKETTYLRCNTLVTIAKQPAGDAQGEIERWIAYATVT